jgi:hypothetical protein
MEAVEGEAAEAGAGDAGDQMEVDAGAGAAQDVDIEDVAEGEDNEWALLIDDELLE